MHLLAVAVAVAVALLPLSSPASFTPSTSYFLACGSSSAVSLADRTFQPDAPYLLVPPSSSQTSTSTSTSPSHPAPYSTSRSFSSDSTYRFTISTAATYILRLHFSSPRFSSSSPRFSVSIPFRFVLLLNFTPPSYPTTKEYLLHAAPGALDLLFTPSPLAFVNAIELFSAPPNLFSGVPPDQIADFTRQALETIHRINAGGPAASDTLWRPWSPDDAFLSSNATSFANSTNQNFITFQEEKGRSEEIAPRIVYSTARTMAINNDLPHDQAYDFNVTWSFRVPPGYLYFVRLHFCDFLFEPGELYFDVYIGDELATKDLHPQDETDGKLASAFYMDYAASPTGPGFINISIGRASKDVQTSSINAILNGLEIMKVNNSGSSLDGGSLSTSVDGGRKMKISHAVVLIVAIVGALVIAAGLGACLFFLCSSRRNRRPKTSPSPSSSKQKESAASWSPFRVNRPTPFTSIEGTTTPGASPIPNMGSLHIPLAEIKLATNGFDESFLIGNGGFGKVYRGVLTDGRTVAVKRATPGSRQGFPEFQTEILVLSNIRHRHLVSLIGFCGEQSEMILVYEYMERGPLKNYLYGDGGGEDLPCLSWKQRLEICIGAARGIHYLHTGYSYNIIHRDVKSSNILLADDYSAKVADFGLSRLGPSFGETHVSTAVKGIKTSALRELRAQRAAA